MTDFLLFATAIVFLLLGNKVFNMSMTSKKETDPPSDFSEVDNPQLLAISFALFFFGCWVLYLFVKTQI